MGQGNNISIVGAFQIDVAPEITTNPLENSIEALPSLAEFPDHATSDVVSIIGSLPYAYITAMLRRRFYARRFKFGMWPSVFVQNVEVFPASTSEEAQIAIRVDYKGHGLRGSLYAWGKPLYNQLQETISIPDLQFTPDTNGLVSRMIRPVFRRPSFVAALRSKAQADLAKQLDVVGAMFPAARHDVGAGVVLQGQADDLRLESVFCRQKELARDF